MRNLVSQVARNSPLLPIGNVPRVSENYIPNQMMLLLISCLFHILMVLLRLMDTFRGRGLLLQQCKCRQWQPTWTITVYSSAGFESIFFVIHTTIFTKTLKRLPSEGEKWVLLEWAKLNLMNNAQIFFYVWLFLWMLFFSLPPLSPWYTYSSLPIVIMINSSTAAGCVLACVFYFCTCVLPQVRITTILLLRQ